MIGWDLALAIAYLGYATAAAGDPIKARTHHLVALSLALKSKVNGMPIALDALFGLADFQAWEGEAAQALELLISVSSHGAASHSTKARAELLAAELEKWLNPKQIAAAVLDASAYSIEARAAELLLAFTPS